MVEAVVVIRGGGVADALDGGIVGDISGSLGVWSVVVSLCVGSCATTFFFCLRQKQSSVQSICKQKKGCADTKVKKLKRCVTTQTPFFPEFFILF